MTESKRTDGDRRREKKRRQKRRDEKRNRWQSLTHLKIYCCGCETDVQARLTSGCEIYPSRPDLAALPFWKCDSCKNHVGCHHKLPSRVQPLGNIPTPALRRARSAIHAQLDPLWQGQGHAARHAIYRRIANELGIPEYHTGNIKSLYEAEWVMKIVLQIAGGA